MKTLRYIAACLICTQGIDMLFYSIEIWERIFHMELYNTDADKPN